MSPFYNDLDKKIINLYNQNDIDLLEARQVTNLKERLKDKVIGKKYRIYFKNKL